MTCWIMTVPWTCWIMTVPWLASTFFQFRDDLTARLDLEFSPDLITHLQTFQDLGVLSHELHLHALHQAGNVFMVQRHSFPVRPDGDNRGFNVIDFCSRLLG